MPLTKQQLLIPRVLCIELIPATLEEYQEFQYKNQKQ